MADRPRIKLPKEAKKGDVIEIKTLIRSAFSFVRSNQLSNI